MFCLSVYDGVLAILTLILTSQEKTSIACHDLLVDGLSTVETMAGFTMLHTFSAFYHHFVSPLELVGTIPERMRPVIHIEFFTVI